MKKLFVCFLMGLLLFAGCGNEIEDTTEQESEPSIPVEITKEESQKKEELTEEELAETELAEVDLITLYKDSVVCEEWGNISVICSSRREIIKIFDEELEKYPKLNNALEDEAQKTADQMTHFMAENLSIAQEEEGNEYFDGYTDELALYVQRADNLIVSVRQDEYQYTGGAHPMYATGGFNIDPLTGENLTISDVVTDFSGLVELLGEKLVEKYGEDIFYDSPEVMLQEYTPEQFGWTMGYQGITFYFTPYELAPYAAGAPMVTIWFDEAKNFIEMINDDFLVRLMTYKNFCFIYRGVPHRITSK